MSFVFSSSAIAKAIKNDIRQSFLIKFLKNMNAWSIAYLLFSS